MRPKRSETSESGAHSSFSSLVHSLLPKDTLLRTYLNTSTGQIEAILLSPYYINMGENFQDSGF